LVIKIAFMSLGAARVQSRAAEGAGLLTS